MYRGGTFCSVTSSPGAVTVSREDAAAVNAAAVNATTGTVTAWNPGPLGPVQALAVSGSTVYIGGQFSTVENSNGTGSVTRNNAAAVNASTGFDTGWDPDPNGYVGALAVSGSTVYLGGRFSAITDSAGTGTVPRYNAAAVSAGTGRDTGWTPGRPGIVTALVVSGSTVYLAGNAGAFTSSTAVVTIKHVRTSRGGHIDVGLNLPDPGAIKIVATVSGGHAVFAQASLHARHGGALNVKLTPSVSGGRVLRRHHKLKLTLAISYTPGSHEVVTLERARVPVTS